MSLAGASEHGALIALDLLGFIVSGSEVHGQVRPPASLPASTVRRRGCADLFGDREPVDGDSAQERAAA
ncbi:Uncharacterised protein [Acinetobacter nosocomialis]|nr:Uncharacterised protein [Acinetobacter nosocomialis]